MLTLTDEQEEAFEADRIEKRKRGRIAFDCFNLVTTGTTRADGESVLRCKLHKISCARGSGEIGEKQVLSGIVPKGCQTCPDYND